MENAERLVNKTAEIHEFASEVARMISTYDLIYEFHVALKAIYRVLDGSIAKSAPFDTEGFLHTMVHNVALKEERERDEHENQ